MFTFLISIGFSISFNHQTCLQKKTIYDFFTLTEKHLDAGKIKAKYKCLICDKEIQINSGVNSNLHEHISKIHNDEYTKFKVINSCSLYTTDAADE